MVFDPEAKHCELCNDTGAVRVIPHGGSGNDAQEDECPWCLRREFNRLRLAEEKARAALRFTIDVIDNVVQYRTTDEAHNAKMAEAREALAPLKEE
jgi:hypothetical protein